MYKIEFTSWERIKPTKKYLRILGIHALNEVNKEGKVLKEITKKISLKLAKKLCNTDDDNNLTYSRYFLSQDKKECYIKLVSKGFDNAYIICNTNNLEKVITRLKLKQLVT